MKTNLLIILIIVFGCTGESNKIQPSLVNLSHLDHLYEHVKSDSSEFAIIRIYSDYPDYRWAWEKHEGIACVDDVARALVVYLNHYITEKDPLNLEKSRLLIKFLLYMQADNGYFYNFILENYQINKDYKRSLPEPNWWTWRALWALVKAQKVLQETDTQYSNQIDQAIKKTIRSIKKDLPTKNEYQNIAGFNIPSWLILSSASDQSAVLIMALSEYTEVENDPELLQYISDLCTGIANMQAGDLKNYPHGAMLSWKNIWHGWGNLQSFALIQAAQFLKSDEWIKIARNELDGFYEHMIKNNFYAEIRFEKNGSQIKEQQKKKYPQIAYIIRPMVYACLKMYDISNDENYLLKASRIGAWLFGANPIGNSLYDPHTGRCFDGIESETEINQNSGAESTIEALLTLQAIEQYSGAKKALWQYINKKNDTTK